jgi:hypothetical protein
MLCLANSVLFILSGSAFSWNRKPKQSMPCRKGKEWTSRWSLSKIKDFLAKLGFNLSNKKQGSVFIYLRTTDNIVRNNSINIAVLTLDIDVTNNSKEIGGKTIILKERYNDSKNSVYKNAAIHFEQDIKSQGINETIGINLNLD